MEISPLEYAGRIAYSSKEVLRFTYDMSVKYKDAPGMYVECGVAAGAQIIAMAAGAPNKTIYAFDSFEGIPLPSNKDDQMPGIKFLSKEEQSKLPNPGEQVLESSGATAVSMEDFSKHLYASGINTKNIVTVPGWFEDTAKEFSTYNVINKIAILRLDGDLYNSTYVCLKYFYPKVIKGGLVIIDDWALLGCQRAVLDYFSEDIDFYRWRLSMEYIKDENSTVAYWTK
jgi:O-methyltransferase